MSRASKKPTSKRRAAALTFLSNISLDTIASQKMRCSDYISQTDEDKRGTWSNTFAIKNSRNVRNTEENTIEEVVSSKFFDLEFTKPSYTPFRERSNTGNSDFGKQKEMKQKKISGVEEILPPLYFSSTESIASGSGKLRADFDPRMHKLKEIKVANANNLRCCKNERIMLLSPATKTPFYVFSFLPYKKIKSKGDSKKETISRRRNLSGSRPLSSFIDTLDPFLLLGLEKYQDEQMISYQQLLLPSASPHEPKEAASQETNEVFQEQCSKNYHITRCMSVDLGVSTKIQSASSSPPFSEFRASDWEEFGFGSSCQPSYSPFLLDDPELMSGKHRTVLTFPSYRASVIDYVRPSELKKELNEKFREKFPQVQLTLSKLRSLKREMKKISKTDGCINLLTVALAYVYFEKLILRNVINKTNRKVCAAVCLLLSAKMNDTKGVALKQLFEKLESVFRINRKDLLALEFAVVVALEFSLHVPSWEILPHYQRLMYES